jgi:hypothetical protein
MRQKARLIFSFSYFSNLLVRLQQVDRKILTLISTIVCVEKGVVAFVHLDECPLYQIRKENHNCF